MDNDMNDIVARLGGMLRARGWTMGTAESCTGGLIADTLTNVSGSSDWFAGAVVAYANAVKTDLLGVPEDVLAAHGAVSEPVVLAMARGLRRRLGVDAAVAVSGIAGPTGGTPDKPVGTVWMAWSLRGEGGDAERAALHRFQGDRLAVKAATVKTALEELERLLAATGPEG